MTTNKSGVDDRQAEAQESEVGEMKIVHVGLHHFGCYWELVRISLPLKEENKIQLIIITTMIQIIYYTVHKLVKNSVCPGFGL